MKHAWLVCLSATSVFLAGCYLNAIAADQAGNIAAASSDYMRGFWDYEIGRSGTASAIMQLEAMHSVSPGNEALSLALVSTYIGHTFGWVELDLAQARADRQFDKAERFRQRAELLYRRARDLALATMRKRDPAIDERLVGEPSALKEYLQREYANKEDLAPVFWTGMAWGSVLGVTDQMDQAIDVPAVRVLIEHVVALDPSYQGGAPLVFLGGLLAQTPAEYGGNPEQAKQYFERALELTERKSHTVQLNYAKLYALTTGDDKLFFALLDEIMAPEDRGSGVRLSNKIARMHAELLLRTHPRVLRDDGEPREPRARAIGNVN
jgi:hypothetical protein